MYGDGEREKGSGMMKTKAENGCFMFHGDVDVTVSVFLTLLCLCTKYLTYLTTLPT